MEIIVNTDYVVVKKVTNRTTHSLLDLVRYLQYVNITSKDYLEGLILDFCWDLPTSQIVKEGDVNDIDEILNQNVENLSELVDHFSYLIKEEPKQESEFIINCCDGQTGKYCSECGKKLK